MTRGDHRARRAWPLAAVLALILSGCAWLPGLPEPPVADPPSGQPLTHEGRWLTDVHGRVVMLHGMNFVEKWAPYTPAAAGFDGDDAALLAANGFNAVRLGVVFGFLMPRPGQIDEQYLDSIANTVQILGQHGLYVLLDFHQDGWGPATHGNGMPGWATLTDGLPNPPAPFPAYYVENPALQRAFDNFWADRAGPDGIPLQDHYAEGMRAVATRFANDPQVLGYEAMNEPWPGANWSPCLTGCPDLERQLLVPFYDRMAAAIRSVDRRHPLYEEPFVLFNFGQADTSLPDVAVPRTTSRVLATHDYALTADADTSVMDRTVAAAQRAGVAAVVDEFGATTDPVTLDRLEDGFDAHLLPWLFWSYDGIVVHDSHKPLVRGNVDETVLDTLTRPYPTAVNGTPTQLHFDEASATLALTYQTTRPDGRPAPPGLVTTVAVPRRTYPHGYVVTATGASVRSRPCAPTITLRNRPGASQVSINVAPANGCS